MDNKPAMRLHLTFWDFLAGLPAGLLIFMSTMTFGTLLRRSASFTPWLDLPLLAIDALSVGLLAGISRLRQGLATALVAGMLSAGLLGFLWLSAHPGETYNPLVFGIPGILLSLLVTPLGGWLGMKLRKIT
jgi:hypothetical protein